MPGAAVNAVPVHVSTYLCNRLADFNETLQLYTTVPREGNGKVETCAEWHVRAKADKSKFPSDA